MKTPNSFLALLLTASIGLTACQPEAVEPLSTTGTTNRPTQSAAEDASVVRDVPAEVMAYVNAVNQNNLDSLALSFAETATIVDVSRRIVGREAIRTWARNEVMGGTLRVVEINARETGRIRVLVHWAPRGSAGWRAWYTFTYRDGRLSEADLQYA